MKNKKNILIIISILLVLVGALLPSIRIAQENINFIKETGFIMVILVLSMVMLYKLNFKQMLFIPAILSISIIVKFIIDNKERINQINTIYNSYATYEYGIIVMLIGNISIIVLTLIGLFNFKKLKPLFIKLISIILFLPKKILSLIKSIKIKEVFSKTKQKFKNLRTKIITNKIAKSITHETTKDGKIKFNKITVKVEKTKKIKTKTTLKEKLQDTIYKIRMNRPFRKKLSISRYRDEEEASFIPVIDIKKWTRSSICCSNCGATVSTNSEYCFLCDCKIKLNGRKKIS